MAMNPALRMCFMYLMESMGVITVSMGPSQEKMLHSNRLIKGIQNGIPGDSPCSHNLVPVGPPDRLIKDRSDLLLGYIFKRSIGPSLLFPEKCRLQIILHLQLHCLFGILLHFEIDGGINLQPIPVKVVL